MIGGGIVAVAVALVGVRLATNSGAKTGLDEALAHLPPGFTAAHGAVSYNALTGEANVRDLVLSKDGKQLFSAGDVVVSGIGAADGTGTPKRIGEVVLHDVAAGPYQHIGRVELTGLSLANLRQVMDPAAYPGGKPVWTDKRPILEHAEAHDISGGQTVPAGQGGTMAQTGQVDVKFGVGSVTMDGLRLSQLPSPPDYTANPAILVALIEQGMSQESGAAKDVHFSSVGPKANIHGDISHIANGRFDSGRVAEMSADTITIVTDQPAGTTTIAGVSGHGLDMSGMLALMPVVVRDPGKPHPEIINGFKINDAELHGLKVDYPSGPLITIDRVSGAAAPEGAPTSGNFKIHSLTVQTSGRPLKETTRAQLDSFGMADFTTDLNEDGGYDPVHGRLAIKRGDIIFHGLGSLHFTLDVTGLVSTPGQTKQQVAAAMAAARLVDASVKWDDASLTGRLLKMVAAKQGVTPEQVMAGLALPLATLPILMPDQPDAGAQVSAFLDGQHSIDVTLNPPVPVSLEQFQSTPSQEKAALLGAHISGN
jgi:hypothetical protein